MRPNPSQHTFPTFETLPLILLQLKAVIGSVSHSPLAVRTLCEHSLFPCPFSTCSSSAGLAKLGGEYRIGLCEYSNSCHKVQIGHGQFGVAGYQFRQYALVSCGGQCQGIEVLVQLFPLGFSGRGAPWGAPGIVGLS